LKLNYLTVFTGLYQGDEEQEKRGKSSYLYHFSIDNQGCDVWCLVKGWTATDDYNLGSFVNA